MLYLELFLTFFKIGLFTIGGGYAMLPLIQADVQAKGWMTAEELVNFIAVSESTPGPFAVNVSTYVGAELAGLPGAFCATLGVVLPSFLIILLVARFYAAFRSSAIVSGAMGGLRPAVVAMIASAGVSILVTALWNGAAASLNPADLDWIAALLFVAALFVLRRWKLNPIWVMVGTGVVGLGLYLIIGY